MLYPDEVFILEFFNTCRIGDKIGLDVAGTLCFQLGGDRRSMNWRQFILALGLHTTEDMAEDEFGAYWLGSERLILDKGDLSDYWVEISSGKDFLRGRKSGAKLSGGHFIGHLAHHFGLVSDDGLRGLSVVARELPLIDMSELATEDAPAVDEGAQADLAPVQASQPPPPPPAAGRTMPRRLGILEEEIQGLHRDVRSLRGLVESSMTEQGRVSTWMISCMTQLMEASGQTYRAFDGTFRGRFLAIFERRTR
ncbi:hypothetical protein Tco_0224075 [Tanacetum coccineum]